MKQLQDYTKSNLKNNSNFHIGFSGGIDSTFLMLALKSGLSENGLVYKDYGKNI